MRQLYQTLRSLSIYPGKTGHSGGICITKYTYTEKRIMSAILALMAERPYEEISISDIVLRAQVGRSSFYRHFNSREDVVRRHMKAILEKWGEEFEALGRPEELGPSLLRHFYGNREFYLLLHRSGLGSLLLEAIRGAMELDRKPDQEAYPLSWFAGGLYGLVDEWLRRGMTATPEQLGSMAPQGGGTP